MMWLILFIYFGICLHHTWAVEGDHVCQEVERFKVNVTTLVPRKVTIRNYKWCASFPPRCSYYTEELQYIPKVIVKEETRIVNKCCPGFKIDETNSNCVFDCSDCVTHQCDLSNYCICPSGFSGPNCDKGCPDLYWGPNCIQKCSCINGDCNPITGYCNCPPGWKGSRCEKQDEVWKMEANLSRTAFPKINNAISSEMNNLVKSLTKQSERAHYPTFQKYLTFIITTVSPPSQTEIESSLKKIDEPNNQLSFSTSPSLLYTKIVTQDSPSTSRTNTPNNSTEVNTEIVVTAKTIIQESRTQQDRTFINNLKTDNVISVTQVSNVIMKEKVMENIEVSVTSPQTVSSEGSWLNDQSTADIETNLSTRRKETYYDSNNSHLIFSIGAIVGVLATIILIVSVTILSTQNYKRRKLSSSFLGLSRQTKNGNADRISAVAIYTRSVFHAPLPDPPTFQNPVFTTPLENKATGGTLKAHVVCSMHLQNETNNKKDARIIDEFYDHPPSTGSYRAASIPEPPEQNLQIVSSISKEHLYDEIPCWRQPTAVTEHITVLPNERMSYYANTT